MGKTKEEKLGCFWEIVGYLILLVSLAWVIGNKEKMGTLGFVAYVVAAIIAISVLRVKSRGSRGGARPKSKFAGVSQPPPLPDYAEKKIEGEKIIFTRLPAYNPKNDYYKFSGAAREINENGWQLIANVETISLLDTDDNQLYQVKYADITSLRDDYIWVNQQKFPVPRWAQMLDKTLHATIIERANLVKIKTTTIVGERTSGGIVDREIEVSYYGREK